jgi:hypothetical protein
VSPQEVSDALKELGASMAELAYEIHASERTVRRWTEIGVTGPGERVIELFLRSKKIGMAWRRNEVRIGIVSGPDFQGRIEMLNDAEAIVDWEIRRHEAQRLD